MAHRTSLSTLPDGLPAGVLVTPDPDFADEIWVGRAALWVSSERSPDAGRHWRRLFDLHAETGLYPLLLDVLDRDPARPWHDGEINPVSAGAIDVLNAEGVLRRFWGSVTDDSDEDVDEDADEQGQIAEDDDIPAGRWPGLARSGEPARDAEAVARHLAEVITDERPRFIGLVPADRGADALTLAGWGGPCNHTDNTQEISAVIRSWEERFGARVVMAGFAELELSVAAPPTTIEHARQVAAEHYAFCPDNIWQGSGSFEAYAKGLIDAERWSFWWD